MFFKTFIKKQKTFLHLWFSVVQSVHCPASPCHFVINAVEFFDSLCFSDSPATYGTMQGILKRILLVGQWWGKLDWDMVG